MVHASDPGPRRRAGRRGAGAGPERRRAPTTPPAPCAGGDPGATDRALDASLEATFPASDPVASFVFD